MADAAWLWDHAGLTYVQMADRLGRPPSGLRRLAGQLGFVRPLGRGVGFVAGPCVDCGIHGPLGRLDPDRRCTRCAVRAGLTPRPPSAEDLFHAQLFRDELRARREDGRLPEVA